MKNFIGTIERNKKYNTIKIYRIKYNTLFYIGEKEYIPGMTKGTESEIYNFLIKNKYIPKKAFNFSKNSFRSEGYYDYDNPYCRIKII